MTHEEKDSSPSNEVPDWLHQDSGITVLELVATTALSRLYKVRQNSLGRLAALKVLGTSDEAEAQRLRREARLLQELDHPCLGRVYGVGVSGGELYMILEWLEGEPLSELLSSQRELELDDLKAILLPVLEGLAYAHRQGVVHRDIKPSNIFVQTSADGLSGKLIDFGLAMEMNADLSLTRTGALLGSPAYMSPEQCAGGAVDHRTDIYSFGCVLYEALTREQVFKGESAMELMYRHLNEEPKLDKLAPSELSTIVKRCLEKSPALRYQSAADLGEAIDAALDSERGSFGESPATGRRFKDHAGRLVALASVLLLAVGSVVLHCATQPTAPSKVDGMETSDWTKNSDHFAAQRDQIDRLFEKGDFPAAIDSCRALLKKALNREQRMVILTKYIEVLKNANQHEEAHRAADTLKQVCDSSKRSGTLYTNALLCLAIIRGHQGRRAEAAGLFHDAIAIRSRERASDQLSRGGWHHDLGCYKWHYAGILTERSALGEQEAVLNEAIGHFNQSGDGDANLLLNARIMLCENLLRQGRTGQAREAADRLDEHFRNGAARARVKDTNEVRKLEEQLQSVYKKYDPGRLQTQPSTGDLSGATRPSGKAN